MRVGRNIPRNVGLSRYGCFRNYLHAVTRSEVEARPSNVLSRFSVPQVLGHRSGEKNCSYRVGDTAASSGIMNHHRLALV